MLSDGGKQMRKISHFESNFHIAVHQYHKPVGMQETALLPARE
jgi:hypothetical protein